MLELLKKIDQSIIKFAQTFETSPQRYARVLREQLKFHPYCYHSSFVTEKTFFQRIKSTLKLS